MLKFQYTTLLKTQVCKNGGGIQAKQNTDLNEIADLQVGYLKVGYLKVGYLEVGYFK